MWLVRAGDPTRFPSCKRKVGRLRTDTTGGRLDGGRQAAGGRPAGGRRRADQGPGPLAAAFGQQIRSVQRDQGLSVRAFAEQLDVSHGFLSDVQAGKAKPSPGLVARIDELGGLHGALVAAYPKLLEEFEARKQARA